MSLKVYVIEVNDKYVTSHSTKDNIVLTSNIIESQFFTSQQSAQSYLTVNNLTGSIYAYYVTFSKLDLAVLPNIKELSDSVRNMTQETFDSKIESSLPEIRKEIQIQALEGMFTFRYILKIPYMDYTKRLQLGQNSTIIKNFVEECSKAKVSTEVSIDRKTSSLVMDFSWY